MPADSSKFSLTDFRREQVKQKTTDEFEVFFENFTCTYAGRLGGSVGNLETFCRWDASSNLGASHTNWDFSSQKNKK